MLDDLNSYQSEDDLNVDVSTYFALELWRFTNEMTTGDVIFAGRNYRHILGRGIVESDYIFDETRNKYKHIRKVRWTHTGKWKHDDYITENFMDITSQTETVNKLETIVSDNETLIEPIKEAKQMTSSKRKYWFFEPRGSRNESAWADMVDDGIIYIEGFDHLCDLHSFGSEENLMNKMNERWYYKTEGLWGFAHDLSVGDIVFARYAAGNIVGLGEIESDYIFDPNRDAYKHHYKIKWVRKGDWKISIITGNKIWGWGGLVNVTDQHDTVAQILNLIGGNEALSKTIKEQTVAPTTPDAYTKADFLKEVYVSAEQYDTLAGLLERKRNLILKGAPGVGKTFAAKRLAFSLMGEVDARRVKIVQFHQSYSYEDFVMGYRPDGDGFSLVEGPFYQFCKTAAGDAERPYFFIIDEINRSNLGKVFGELLMLIEDDKRGQSIQLMYKSDEAFAVPKNIYVIGMMNTADRSLAMMDYALRRRFAFFDMEPAFQSKGFKKYQSGKGNARFDFLIAKVESLNKAIGEDKSLGLGFRVGHSYFCTDRPITNEWLSSVVEYELIPLLEEYWFDEPNLVEQWSVQLRGVLNG